MAEVQYSSTATSPCPECGVAVTHDAPRCWLCGQAVVAARAAALRPRRRDTGHTLRFQLHSMFLSMGLISFCLAVARHWPDLAMALVVPLVTAYLRTLQISVDHAQAGQPLGGAAKIVWFVRSLGVALTILVGAVSALVVSIGVGAALGLGASHWREEPIYGLVGFAVGTSFGVFGALALAAWTGQRLWPGPIVQRREAE